MHNNIWAKLRLEQPKPEMIDLTVPEGLRAIWRPGAFSPTDLLLLGALLALLVGYA